SCPSPCRLGERGSQPPVARSPALSFAGTLMVTLDKPSPKMPDGDNRKMALLDSCPFPSPLRWSRRRSAGFPAPNTPIGFAADRVAIARRFLYPILRSSLRYCACGGEIDGS